MVRRRGKEALVLEQEERGTVVVPGEWTDSCGGEWDSVEGEQATILEFWSLVDLAEIVCGLKGKAEKRVDK